MDIRQLELPSSSIDVAIDKATLDAFIHGSIWDPPDDVKESVGRYVDEVCREGVEAGWTMVICYVSATTSCEATTAKERVEARGRGFGGSGW
ncbi:hypothetical protein D0Z07_8055 [Hyphodiscus hymeniophilus]|uniref:Uncharacterized protein n=1 Tax=Hyphodiscus hymeniophilus TaxID=353542 RepID=A0A9P6VDZ5_9HELO|nr:hypothetical protein D0Z07_8055 [Hyphodiscus hymeniophilus]